MLSIVQNTLLKIEYQKVRHQILYSNVGYALSVLLGYRVPIEYSPYTLLKCWVWKVQFSIPYSNFEYPKYDLQYSTLILSTKKYDPLKSTQIWVTLLNTPLQHWTCGHTQPYLSWPLTTWPWTKLTFRTNFYIPSSWRLHYNTPGEKWREGL